MLHLCHSIRSAQFCGSTWAVLLFDCSGFVGPDRAMEMRQGLLSLSCLSGSVCLLLSVHGDDCFVACLSGANNKADTGWC